MIDVDLIVIVASKRLFRLSLNILNVVAHLVQENVVDFDARLLLDLIALALRERVPSAPEHNVERFVVRGFLVLSVLRLKVVGVIRLYGAGTDGHVDRRGTVAVVELRANRCDVQITLQRVIRLATAATGPDHSAAVDNLRLEEFITRRVLAVVVRLVVDLT